MNGVLLKSAVGKINNYSSGYFSYKIKLECQSFVSQSAHRSEGGRCWPGFEAPSGRTEASRSERHSNSESMSVQNELNHRIKEPL